MKNTLILLLILALLTGTYFLLQKKEDTKIEQIMEDRAFAVPKEKIKKVIIAHKDGKIETLKLEDDQWTIDGKYPVAKDGMSQILDALSRVRLQSIPAKAATEHIIKEISSLGIKILVYGENDELLSNYYIGGVNSTETGTYYLMDGANQPYTMELPGMVGSPRVRFVKEFDQWRDRAVFKYDNKFKIKKVSLDYPRSKNKSFVIENNKGKSTVMPLYDFTPRINKSVNNGTLDKFLENITNVYSEAFINGTSNRDTLMNMLPFVIIKVEDVDGDIRTVALHPSTELEAHNPIYNSPSEAHKIERYYGVINDGEDIMTIQQRLIGKILWSYDYFYQGL